MDRRERINDPTETIRSAIEGTLAGVWTAMPGIVEAVDIDKMTCTVQPAIIGRMQSPAGDWAWVKMPLLLDVPIMFLGGGGFTLTFPFAKGDEGLTVFSCRDIGGWWQSGDVQVPPELRMHDLSDGFFIPGFRSQPRVIGGISGTRTELRGDDGAVKISIGPTDVAITAPGGLTVTGPTVFAGTVTANGHRIDNTHTHGGVTPGGGTTGIVT